MISEKANNAPEESGIVTVRKVADCYERDENVDGIRKATASKLKNPEQVEIDARLMSLVVEPINALPKAQRTARSGEEIARAIPDVEAFLSEVYLQKQDGILMDFFELNEAGQLVMKDDCPEAYGLGENPLQARIRQTRIVYRGEDGQTKVMTGEECFKVTYRDQDQSTGPLAMELSEAARNIVPKSILMVRGLPTLKRGHGKHEHVGEYARMNPTGQLDRENYTWTYDDLLRRAEARWAHWDACSGHIVSLIDPVYAELSNQGSRGVLRVNLNLEA